MDERVKELENELALYRAIIPWGSHDIATAAEWLDEADVDAAAFGEYVEDYAKDTGTPLGTLDICALALDFISGEAGANELADHVYGNYLCSSFDISEDEAGRILAQVPEDDRNAAWVWLQGFAGATVESAEESSVEPAPAQA